MIKAEGLSMWYGSTRALEDASFEVNQGEVLGLLGPNGAGKSTTLKILTTFIYPTSGRFEVDGIDAAEDPLAVRRKIGYLPETAPLYVGHDGRASTWGSSALPAASRGARLSDRRDIVVGECGLSSVYNRRPIGHLSKGYRQRVGLAQALIHDPEIVILDEPTSGLDPLQIVGIREPWSSGLGERTRRSCSRPTSSRRSRPFSDRVMIINEGRIIAERRPRPSSRRAR